jgi:hypothetical protein
MNATHLTKYNPSESRFPRYVLSAIVHNWCLILAGDAPSRVECFESTYHCCPRRYRRVRVREIGVTEIGR